MLLVYNDEQLNQVQYINVTLNGTIILECGLDGDDLSLQWLLNGHPIDLTVSPLMNNSHTCTVFLL